MLERPFTKDSGYTSDEDYLTDIAVALREEIDELYDNGLRNVQIDDPLLSMFYTDEWAPALRKHGTDIERLVDLYIKTYNAILRDLPSGLNVAHHMCRGNVPGQPTLTGSYESIAAKLLKESDFKLFCFEYDQPEHGDFSPLRHLPRDKAVILGLATTKDPELEGVEALKERVLKAADAIADA